MRPWRAVTRWFWPMLLAGLLVLQFWKDGGLVAGRPPPLEARALDGTAFSWDEAAGRPVVLYFWATWCPVCRAMRGNIEALARDHTVVTVALQSGSAEALREYARTQRFTPSVYPDPTGAIASRYGVQGVPAIFVIGPAGDIRYAMTGYSTEFGLRARIWLAAHED